MTSEKKRLIIIDSNAIVHRAFHALPPLTTKTGEAVGAIYGFLLFFLKAIKEFNPDFIAAAFDFPAPTFRHQKYKLYKATRERAPDELYLQIPKVKEALEKIGVAVFEQKGFEADDIIGTIAKKVSKQENEVETLVLTGDLDTLQLVDDKIRVYALKRGIKDAVLYDEKKVEEKYEGLEPEQLVDFKALRGDPSDNIPGVFGVGEKTAISLIKEFGSLDNLYRELDQNGEKAGKIKTSLKEKLLKDKETAYASKMLAEIDKAVPLDFDLTKCRWQGYDLKKVTEVLEKYNFRSLIARISDLGQPEKKGEQAPSGRKEAKAKNQNNLSLF